LFKFTIVLYSVLCVMRLAKAGRFYSNLAPVSSEKVGTSSAYADEPPK
jgi:hypothetical protein